MIYAYLQADPWREVIIVQPVNERAHRRRMREAEAQGGYVKPALSMLWADKRYWHWYYQVPEKYLSDFRMGLPVRVKVDPAIFEVT